MIFTELSSLCLTGIYICLYSLVLAGGCESAKSVVVSLDELAQTLNENVDADTLYVKEGRLTKRLVLESRQSKPIIILPLTYGSLKVTDGGEILIRNSQNLTIEGFLFEETGVNTIVLDNSSGIHIKNNYFYRCGESPSRGSIIRIRNGSYENHIVSNTFDDNRAIGITLSTASANDRNNKANRIYDNIFINVQRVKSVYPDSDGNGMECIQLGSGGVEGRWWHMGTEIHDNLFENVVGDGVEIISNKSSGNTIYDNSFVNNQSGITIRYGNGVVVRSNILYNTTRGIRVYGRGHKILGNVIIGGDVGLILPSANSESGTSLDRTNVYFQIDSLEVSRNLILDQRSEAISIGLGKSEQRQLMPKNMIFENNTLRVLDTLNYIRSEDSAISQQERSSFGRSNNVTMRQRLSAPSTSASLMIRKLVEEVVSDEASTTGALPIKVLDNTDMSLGAKWRRPK